MPRRVPRKLVRSQSVAARSMKWGALLGFLPYLGVALLCSCLPLLLYQLWIVLVTSPALAVCTVVVEGNQHLSANEVIEVCGIQDGMSLLRVDEDVVVERVGKLAWVVPGSVEVDKELPDTVVIRIKERSVGAILLENGAFLVDSAGEIFKEMSPEEYQADTLVVSGLEASRILRDGDKGARKMVQDNLTAAIRLHRQYKELGLDRYGEANEVEFDELHGFDLVTKAGQRFHFGFGDHDVKLKRLSVVLSDLASRGSPVGDVHLDNEADPGRVAVSGTNVRFDAGRRMERVPASAQGMLP